MSMFERTRRFLVTFEIDNGQDTSRGNTEVEWTGPMGGLDDIRSIEAMIGEQMGGVVVIMSIFPFED